MKLKEKDYAKIIARAANKKVDAKQFASELWLSMYKNKMLSKVGRIFNLAEEIFAEANGSIIVTISSALVLDEDQSKKIEMDLRNRFQKEIVADYIINPSLGTGVKIIAKDKIIDLSSKYQIERLNNHLSDKRE